MCVHCGTVYNSKDLEPTQMSIIDRLDKENVAHIHTMEYYTSIKNDEFVSFIGSWMNLEIIIHSKLTQEHKTKHCMFSLIGGCRTIRTHGYKEGNIALWDLSGVGA